MNWIATADRLPDTETRGDDHWIVIALPNDQPRVIMAQWDGLHGHWERNERSVIPAADVSHWMPVIAPELP
jgi:hypothetical protein